MRWLDRIFTRRGERPIEELPERARRRLVQSFRELSAQEKALQARMGLVVPPCLTMVDEEQAAIIPPALRDDIETEYRDS